MEGVRRGLSADGIGRGGINAALALGRSHFYAVANRFGVAGAHLWGHRLRVAILAPSGQRYTPAAVALARAIKTWRVAGVDIGAYFAGRWKGKTPRRI